MHWKINYQQNIKSSKLNNIPPEFLLFKDRINIIAKITSSNDKIWINNYLGSINIMFHNFIPVNLFTLRTRKTITYDEHRSKTRSCSISYSNYNYNEFYVFNRPYLVTTTSKWPPSARSCKHLVNILFSQLLPSRSQFVILIRWKPCSVSVRASFTRRISHCNTRKLKYDVKQDVCCTVHITYSTDFNLECCLRRFRLESCKAEGKKLKKKIYIL